MIYLSILFLVSSLVAKGDWTYENGNPSKWKGASCQSGGLQSPVNLGEKSFIAKKAPKLKWKRSGIEGSFINNGHTVQVNIEESLSKLIVPGKNSSFTLKQFHFHAPSEHHLRSKYSR